MDKELRQVIADTIRGDYGNYSAAQRTEAIRNKLIEANGSDMINYNNFYRGSQSYQLVTELIRAIVDEKLTADNPFFTQLVEYKDVANGDVNEFLSTGDGANELIVSDSAAGIFGIRRSRISNGEKVRIKTSLHSIRVYEALGRLLSGRSTFSDFVNDVSTKFNRQVLADAYKAISAIGLTTPGLTTECIYNGTFSEAELIKIIDYVEMSTGKTAKLIGTRSTLRKVTTAVLSAEAKSDLYNLGYYGKFLGNDMIVVKDALGANNKPTFGGKLLIIAADDKPIKFVREGAPMLLEKDATANTDATQEYFYGELYGVGTLLSSKMGVANLA